MSNPFFDVNGIIGSQMNSDLVKNALEALKAPIAPEGITADFVKNMAVPDTADLIREMDLGGPSAQIARIMDVYRPEMFSSINRSIDVTQVLPRNWVAETLHPDLMKEARKPYWVNEGALHGINIGHASEAVAALGRDLPRADLSAQIAALMNSYQVIPDDLRDRLVGKINVLSPQSWEMAYNLVENENEVKEHVERFIEERPDEADEIVSSVTGKSPNELLSMSWSQVIKALKDLISSAGGVVGTATGSVTVSVIVFIIVMSLSSLETELEDEEGKVE